MTTTLPEAVAPVAPAPRTHLPVATALGPAPGRRKIRGVPRQAVLDVIGAAVSAICTSLLLFGRVAPIEGGFGFVIVTYALFVAAYALMTAFTENRPAVVDRVMAVLLATAAAVAFLALTTVLVFVVVRGRTALLHTNFFTQDMRHAGPREALEVGGIEHAIVGSLIIIGLALAVTVPLGITCAVFLTETRSRFVRPVRTIVDAMTALPSIIAGLFIFAVLVLVLGFERSGFAASLAVSLMMLPIVIRSSDVVLRLVPGNLREASAALGAPTWRTVWHVVLPTARSGLTTSVILGMARGIGETAPVLLTSGFAAVMNWNPLHGPMASLSLTTFRLATSGQELLIARGFGTAVVLMGLVLVLFTTARVLGGRPAGVLTKGQRRRLARKSQRDLQRFLDRGVANA